MELSKRLNSRKTSNYGFSQLSLDMALSPITTSSANNNVSLSDDIFNVGNQHTFNYTEVSIEILNNAMEELVGANSPLFLREIEILSTTQINFLKAISQGELKLTSIAVMQKYQLGTPRNVQKNKVVLTYNDMLNFENGKYVFLDPVFEIWFKKVFFRTDYLLKI